MALTPKRQIGQLALGSFISLVAMLALIITSELESSLVFYSLSFILVLGVIYAIPGYIGIWVWRMRDVLFDQENKDD